MLNSNNNGLLVPLNFLHRNKHKCDQCDEKFQNYDDLIQHARHVHHHTIVTCTTCGKEFIHEHDRLHHAREEHQELMKERSHRASYPDEFQKPQDRVEKSTHKFSDDL